MYQPDSAGSADFRRLPAAIPQVFAECAKAYPDACAIRWSGGSLTYRELEHRVEYLAGHLAKEWGLPAGAVIGLHFRRSADYVVALLAVLRAGLVGLPLDIDHRPEFLRWLLNKGEVAALITNGGRSELDLDIELPRYDIAEINYGWSISKDCQITGDRPALKLHTSGSSGSPKMATLAHHGLVTMVREQIRGFGIGADDHILFSSAISFDSSVAEIFTALFAGATLVVEDLPRAASVNDFVSFLKRYEVSVATFGPSSLHAYHFNQLKGLRVMIVAGDVLYKRQITPFFRHIRCYNGYGLTESSVCSAFMYIDPDQTHDETLPIGKAIGGTTITVRDDHLQEVEPGQEGEICIGGAGLALHLHDPDDTAPKRLVADPQNPQEMLLRTGDRGVCWRDPATGRLASDCFVCLGRISKGGRQVGADHRHRRHQEQLFEYLRTEGYRPQYDEDGDIVFRFRGLYFFLLLDQRVEGFYRLLSQQIMPIEEDQAVESFLPILNEINCRTRGVLSYIKDRGVHAKMDFHYQEIGHLQPVFQDTLRVFLRWIKELQEHLPGLEK